MMEKKRYIIKENKSKGIIAVFFGILIFIIFFFPFYGLSLRYYIGYGLKKLFNGIGMLSLMGGTFLLILSAISLLLEKKIRLGWFVVAIALFWVGSWCTGIIVEILGIPIGNTQGSGAGSGFH